MRDRIMRISTTLIILLGFSAIFGFSGIIRDQEITGPAKIFFFIFLLSFAYALYILGKKDLD